MSLVKKKCTSCSKETRKLYIRQNKMLCFKCSRKYNVIMPGIYTYVEPRIKLGSVNLFLTEDERTFINKRTKELNLSRLSYFRELIRLDMLNQKEVKGDGFS